jgi:hypothetical protein
MTDLEFDILDELYFVQHFEKIQKSLNMSPDDLLTLLAGMHAKGWIKCFSTPTQELFEGEINIGVHGRSYYYLATKAGLLKHHGV